MSASKVGGLQVPPCPRCNNKDAYVTRLEPAIESLTADIIACHCGKCSHMFEEMVERRSAAVFTCAAS